MKEIDIANKQLEGAIRIANISKNVWIEKAINILENIPDYEVKCECKDCEYITKNIKLLKKKLK